MSTMSWTCRRELQLTLFPRYIQAHALGYMMKLNIEMNLADLIGKVVKKSSEPKITFTEVWPPDHIRDALKRELQQRLRKVWKPKGAHIRGGHAGATCGTTKEKRFCPVKPFFRKGSSAISVRPIHDPSPFSRAAKISDTASDRETGKCGLLEVAIFPGFSIFHP